MAQRAGRIACPRCGANNFDTVTSCWKCGAPVGSNGIAAPMQPVTAGTAPVAQPAPYAQERLASQAAYSQPAPAAYSPAPAGDHSAAKRAAVAFALTIPFLALPVGWVFVMLEDRQKQAIGKWCVNWSVLGLVLHTILTYFLVQSSMSYLMRILLMVAGAAAHKGATGSD
ncbi:MAG TPA: hypothetical protein VKT77_08390 [Chthonomonadaceae bacterium]|nr:hypothetical protein [Chthonomonadaceae bacterium]